MMENLDYRLRQLEGATPCFFLPLEGFGLAQAMQAAAAYYDGRSPGKGKPHPDKYRKTTLAGALVKFAAERELQRLSPEAQAALAQTDKLLAATRRPSLVEQHEIIKVMFPLIAIPEAIEPEGIDYNFWKAKKDTKYVLTVQFQPHGVLAQVMPFIEFVILATGGLASSGVERAASALGNRSYSYREMFSPLQFCDDIAGAQELLGTLISMSFVRHAWLPGLSYVFVSLPAVLWVQ
eukprot:s2891_g4.t1